MSLIADSLKKALKAQEPSRASRPEFNLLGKAGDIKRNGNIQNVLRFIILIVIPGVLLVYLIHKGAFDNILNFKFKDFPVWKTGDDKSKTKIARVPVAKRLKPEPVAEKKVKPEPVMSGEPSPKGSLVIEKKNKSELVPLQPPPIRSTPKFQLNASKGKPKNSDSELKFIQPEKELTFSTSSKNRIVKPIPPGKLTELEAKNGKNENKTSAIKVKKKLRVAFKPLPRTTKTPLPKAPKTPLPAQIATKKKRNVVLLSPPAKSPLANPIWKTHHETRKESVTQQKWPQKVSKNVEFYYNQGLFYQESGDYENALISYHKAVELEPENPEIHNNLGLNLKELGHYDKALDEFMRAIMIDPDHVKAYNNLGVIYYIKGNIRGALNNYHKALEINPDNLETYNNLGVVYKSQDWLGKAESFYNKALSLNPKHPGTNYNLGLLYEDMNNIKSAIYFYRRFIKFGVISHPLLVDQIKNHLKSLERNG